MRIPRALLLALALLQAVGITDYMRRVATGVYVGKAYRAGEDIDAHFSLTLQPPAPPEQSA